MRYLFIIMFIFSCFADEVRQRKKEEFYDSFYSQKLIQAHKSVSKQIQNYNLENPTNKLTLQNDYYFFRRKEYTVKFTYMDIIFNEVSINDEKFKLVPNESRSELLKRLSKFKKKSSRKQTYYSLIVLSVYAESEEAFDAMLSVLLKVTRFDDPFRDGKFKEDANKILENINEKKIECLNARDEKKDLDVSSDLVSFIISVNHVSISSEVKEFKDRMNELIIEDTNVSDDNEVLLKERVLKFRGCASLGYLVGRDIKEMDSNIVALGGGRYFNKIDAEDEVMHPSYRESTSPGYAMKFCDSFEELANCMADVNSTNLLGNTFTKFKRTKKQLIDSTDEITKPSGLFKEAVQK